MEKCQSRVLVGITMSLECMVGVTMSNGVIDVSCSCTIVIRWWVILFMRANTRFHDVHQPINYNINVFITIFAIF